MSTNSTVIPGLHQAGVNPNQNPQMGGASQFMNNRGPVPPAMNASKNNSQIFGFLFSVSKTEAGEYWPLYLGGNSIGRDQQNTIVLSESTVSESHADIHVISRSGKLTVYITDAHSKTGTLLNGNLLRGEADLNNGDILTIGEHYELLVIIINPVELGLRAIPEFVSASPAPSQGPVTGPSAPYNPGTAFNMPQPGAGIFGHQQNFQPSQPASSVRNPNATVIDGQSGPAAPVGGHTVISGNPFTK